MTDATAAHVTMAQYSRAHCVSRNSVSRWKASKLLVLVGNLVNVAASDAILRGARLGRFRDLLDGAETPPDARPAPLALSPGRIEGEGDGGGIAADPEAITDSADAFIRMVLSGRYSTTAEAERVKQNALALKHVLEVRKQALLVVSREAVEREAFDLARSWRDSWLGWSARTAPLLAADLGIEPDNLAGLLAGHVHRQLVELGEPELDFSDRD